MNKTKHNKMITETKCNGRLGNQIIRNIAVSLLANKHDLQVKYCNGWLISQLGIDLYSGNNVYDRMELLTDDNYFSVYRSNSINYGVDPNSNYFQTKEITNFIYKYLHSNGVKSNIMARNPFKERYDKNRDLYVHIRLTDVAVYNPGIEYYMNAIKKIRFDNLYISTDDKYHSIVQTIFSVYPDAQLIDCNEISTFQFASTCKNIILSHGSFSAVIGYLSFYSDVYYPEYEASKIWYGDMFSIENWTKLSVK